MRQPLLFVAPDPARARRTRRAALPLLLFFGLLAGLPAQAVVEAQPAPATQVAQAAELADMSLEQLRELVVSTVSRSDEPLDRVAASVYVIGADQIRRSGASTLPEVLRLAPTLTVARADGNQYAISARGFDNVLANKLLVLIDGRTLYTPLFSGVLWEVQDLMLEDIERIEVITGPSTALWGSNAVNALVHIITRSASNTRGLAASVQLSEQERSAALRWGSSTPGGAAWRAYVKSYNRGSTLLSSGTPVGDGADGAQLGWRADWAEGAHQVTLQGDG
jgi:iron complex outermembrane receptor protein